MKGRPRRAAVGTPPPVWHDGGTPRSRGPGTIGSTQEHVMTTRKPLRVAAVLAALIAMNSRIASAADDAGDRAVAFVAAHVERIRPLEIAAQRA